MKRLFTILTTLALLCAVGCEEQGDDNVNPNDKPNTEEPSDKPNDGGNENEQPDDAYIALSKEIISFAPDGGSVDVRVYSNYAWELSNTCDWITTSVTGGEASEAGTTVTLTTELTYDDREGTIIFSCGKAKKVLVVSQGLKEVIIADENNTFSVSSEGGIVTIAYQTSIECEVIIPDEAKEWITFANADATRGLVAENINLNIAENTTYSERSAVVKVVKVGDNTLFAEYTINQVQNNAIIADKNNTFNLKGWAQSINIAYKTNVECEVVIPEEAQSWISLAPATRALVDESATLNITENNTGAERSAVVKVVATNNNELVAEYTITQHQRYFIEYTSADGSTITPNDSSAFDATIIRNEYIDGKGYIDFDAPITSIGDSAFLRCSSLTSITIPDSVTSIGEGAFYECSSLTSVTIPDSVTSIDWYAFAYCTSLTSVTIPDSVTSIRYAFENCSSLTSFYGKYASEDGRCLIIDGVLHSFAPAGITEYIIPDSVTSIGSSAFGGCSSLTSITIPDSVTSIGNSAFRCCYSLTSITIPDSVTSIGIGAFAYCTSLTSITIPDSVTSIGYSAFWNCTSLKSVTIPDSVTSIGGYAFFYCESLTSITIPDSVTSIGEYAFNGCSSLAEVYCKPTTPPIGGVLMFYDNASGRKIYVPTESVNAYKKASYWREYADYIVGYDFE